MNSITRIDKLFQDPSSQPPKKESPYDQELKTLEHFIDKMVAVENNRAKADVKAAIEKAQLLEEFERKIAFLSDQIHRTQSELAALEGSRAQASNTPQSPSLIDSKRQEVTYWKSRLNQVVESNEL